LNNPDQERACPWNQPNRPPVGVRQKLALLDWPCGWQVANR